MCRRGCTIVGDRWLAVVLVESQVSSVWRKVLFVVGIESHFYYNFEVFRGLGEEKDLSIMQLLIRGQGSHVIDCEGNESVGQIKEQVAKLEGIPVGEVCLYCSGSPLNEEDLVANLRSFSIDVSVSLKGGKVHGSLARAGKVKGQTPKVDKQEKKKKKTGRAKRRIQYNRRFVNVVQGFGRRRGPNANS